MKSSRGAELQVNLIAQMQYRYELASHSSSVKQGYGNSCKYTPRNLFGSIEDSLSEELA